MSAPVVAPPKAASAPRRDGAVCGIASRRQPRRSHRASPPARWQYPQSADRCCTRGRRSVTAIPASPVQARQRSRLRRVSSIPASEARAAKRRVRHPEDRDRATDVPWLQPVEPEGRPAGEFAHRVEFLEPLEQATAGPSGHRLTGEGARHGIVGQQQGNDVPCPFGAQLWSHFVQTFGLLRDTGGKPAGLGRPGRGGNSDCPRIVRSVRTGAPAIGTGAKHGRVDLGDEQRNSMGPAHAR